MNKNICISLALLLLISTVYTTGGSNGGVHPAEFNPDSNDLDKLALDSAI
jgi:hypothetical protein